jgi:glutathione S-transferase
MAAPMMTIGYWKGWKGLGERVKLLAEYLHLPYIWKPYVSEAEDWGKDKATLKTDFPNLPYIIDGDVVMSESAALMHYLALKGKREDLLGKNTAQRVEVTTILGVLQDVQSYTGSCLRGQAPWKETWEKQIVPRFEKISKHLGTKKFICDDLTIADFVLFTHLQMHSDLKPDSFDKLPNLKEYFARFSAIPEIAAYLASDRTYKSFLPATAIDRARKGLEVAAQ